MSYPAGKRSIIPINGSGGAFVSVTATAGARRLVIQECAPENPPDGSNYDGTNFNPQGLNYTRPDDAFTQVFPLLPDDQLVFDNPVAQGHGAGALQGGPAQQDPAGRTIAATIYCKMKSATATATQVLLIEYA